MSYDGQVETTDWLYTQGFIGFAQRLMKRFFPEATYQIVERDDPRTE